MSEMPTPPTEPIAPSPVPSIRSRRRLVIGVAAGLVVAVAAFIGLRFALNALNGNAPALYTSEAEHYSVMAPGEPTPKQELVTAIGLPATVTHWTDGDLYYSVSSADGDTLPPTPIWRGMFLHDVMAGALVDAPGVSASSLESDAVANAFLIEPEQITLGDGPAFHFTLTVDGAPAPFHVIFAGHEFTGDAPMLFMLVYSESADSRDEDFLESFTFLD